MHDLKNKSYSCIIVDDEPLARDVLRRYIAKLPLLHLSGECSNAIDALIFLQNNPVDLIFLDIRMPELLGTEFVQALKQPPKVIFTTAFKEYAVDGFDLDAIDYLLKPIRFERFLKAVNKAFPKENNQLQLEEISVAERKTGTDFIYVLYIESAGDYVKLFTKEKTFITRQTISSIEAMLSGKEFVRIHRSYIISINKIKSVTNELVEIGNKELPVGKLYRNSLAKLLQ
jgi:two-component system LytT family response regulator